MDYVKLFLNDPLVVHSMDRLARNLDDLRRIVSDLTDRGVSPVPGLSHGQAHAFSNGGLCRV